MIKNLKIKTVLSLDFNFIFIPGFKFNHMPSNIIQFCPAYTFEYTCMLNVYKILFLVSLV